jgi:16S rRNA (adenine1518-N6/adenine1519-N6)-dimethyltransferase
MPRQKLGQHFLQSPAWRERIARTLPADANATWIEIGPGHGEMTEFLARHSRRVIAIETDATLATSLRERATQNWPNVEIIESDILTVDLAELINRPAAAGLCQGAALAVPKAEASTGPLGPEASLNARNVNHPVTSGSRFRVYGNLPYYITSPILSHLFRYAAQIDSIHIVIQWEVAERIVATPGHREYAYLSALCQYFTRPEIVFRIPPGAFLPPPQVNSALLALALPGERARLGVQNDAAFLKFLQNCFSKKRKTLRNNLKETFSDAKISAALAACKLTQKSRAEELPLRQFAQLYCQLASEK